MGVQKKAAKLNTGSPHFAALIQTAAFMAVWICLNPTLSKAGDLNVAEFLMSGGRIRSGFFFISPGLAKILRWCGGILPGNWWALISIVLVTISVYIFLWYLWKCFMDSHIFTGVFFSLFFMMVLWEMFMRLDLNFTQTSTMAALSGFLLIYDAFNEERRQSGKRTAAAMITAGVILGILAGEIRLKALILVLPFEWMVIGYRFLLPLTSRSIPESVRKSFVNKKRFLACLAVCTGIVISSFAIQRIYWAVNPQWKEYTQANALREDICDYFDRYPPYNENRELYEERGLTESWVNMVKNFNTSDENHFSSEQLRKMVELRGKSTMTVGIFKKVLGWHASACRCFVLFLLCLFLYRGWKNSALPMLGFICSFVMCSFYLIHLGRIMWHVINGYTLCGIMAFIAMQKNELVHEPVRRVKLSAGIFWAAVSALMLAFLSFAMYTEKKGHGIPRPQVTDSLQAQVLDYIDKDGDTPYFYGKIGYRYTVCHNIWSSHSSDYLDNYFPLSGNMILGSKDKLAEFGIEDVYRSLYENPDVRIFYCKDMVGDFLTYMQEYYNDHIAVSEAEAIPGARFIRYSAPMIPAASSETGVTGAFALSDKYAKDENVVLEIAADLTLDHEQTEKYQDFYINVVENPHSGVYSYGMTCSDGALSGKILCTTGTWTKDSATAAELVGRTAEGEIVKICDLTQQFLKVLE